MGSKKCDLLIVGGGAGGLVLALSLAKKGFRVSILDRQTSPVPHPRGEILQPNGLKILDELGLLQDLLKLDLHLNKWVHFSQATGQHLCTINYTSLPNPYNYSLILLPEVLQDLLLERVAATANIECYWGTSFKALLREGTNVTGVIAEEDGRDVRFDCPVVVGGDGVQSPVRRAFNISHRVKAYAEGYVTMLVNRPAGFKDNVRYYLGKGMIFGAFPVSSQRIYLFYLVPTNRLEAVKARGIAQLNTDILSLHPEIESMLVDPMREIVSWEQTAYMRCFRVRCDRWVTNGGALLGDAAHAMNPHVAQGRNSAMADAVVLSKVLEDCFQKGDFSMEALSQYERLRRRDVDMLQALGDEMALLWNSRFPPLICLRDRIFKKIQRRQNLHDKLLKTVAGVQMLPFNLIDRWHAISP